MTSEKMALCQKLEREYPTLYRKVDQLPSAYRPDDINKVKAILLGADPGNQSFQTFKYVFGIEGGDRRYHAGIEANLKVINLTLKDCYVQNLCQNYFTKETSKNGKWKEIAQLWIPVLKAELKQAQIPDTVPVFLTTSHLIEALVKEKASIPASWDHFYKELSFIHPEDNHLERTLIPFFRHGKYKLENWGNYAAQIISHLEKT